jgi:DNA-binding NarL/FixJ family response regulator
MELMTRAMIFEANPTFQEIFKDIFRSRFRSVELLEAVNGEKAMEKVEGFLPDLILIDIHLPDDNALGLIQRIKARHPEIIVILLGSYDLPEYREAASRHGADYFMFKDSPTGDYFALIESILSARGLSLKNAS